LKSIPCDYGVIPLAACPFLKLPENAVTAPHLLVTN